MRTISQAEGIEILEIAGFTVKTHKTTFTVYKDGKPTYGCSNIEWLTNLSYLIKQIIQYNSFHAGVRTGRNDLKKQINKLLTIED